MDEQKLNILNGARLLFMKLGIKSVSMDDLARELGVSKKTLYQHFPDKNDLVYEVMLDQIEKMKIEGSMVFDNDENPIKQLFHIGEVQCREMQHINPVLFYDLKKYYPKVSELLENHKKVFIREKVFNNIKRGIEQGLYRADLNAELMTDFYLCLISHLISGDSSLIRSLSFVDVVNQVLLYNLRGISSTNGLKLIEQFQKNDTL